MKLAKKRKTVAAHKVEFEDVEKSTVSRDDNKEETKEYADLRSVMDYTIPFELIYSGVENESYYDILYDILIKQNGDIHSDWTGVLLDVDAYEKVVFEPYDLKWLTRIA